jgi:hypothetical protein
MLAVALSARGQPAPAEEYRVKAAFLLNFTHFVEWPPGTFASPDAPLELCVIGTDPFGQTLEQTVEGESVDERGIVVRRPRTAADAQGCHVTFISRSEEDRVEEDLRAIGSGAPMLLVSDVDLFASRGGTIGFFLDRSRVRFEIGLGTARRRGLKLSSQLLSLGRIVP